MKSKIDLTSADTFDAVVGLLYLIGVLGIVTAEDLNDEAHVDHMCDYCEKHSDRCSCGDDDSNRRYDEYDDEGAFD